MSQSAKHPHITVVGDLILDRYLIGDATKLNPEQPGVVIRVEKEEDRLGGAAAVAMIAAGLGARVTLAGVVGRDEPGNRLQHLLKSHDIEPYLWIDNRPTTWKQRIVTRGHLRPDRCDREVTNPVSDAATQFLSTVPISDALLISDYGKGLCTRILLQSLGDRARDSDIPILVDPASPRDWADYGQVTLIKANRGEAIEAADSDCQPPLALARHLSDEHGCHVVVTLGRHGMVCAERSGEIRYLPSTDVEVRDVCGAGDTVSAAIGVALATGETVWEACRCASVAANSQVAQVGVSIVIRRPCTQYRMNV